MENIDLVIILVTAFLGSVGHCIGMCGGIVIAYSSRKIDSKTSWVQQTASHLFYNFGRVATYTLLGAFFGLLGKVIAFTPTTRGILFIFAGTLMILAGLSLVGNLKFLISAEWSISKKGWFQKAFRTLISGKSYMSFFLLGMLNGLIPCGLVYSFAVIAASTTSPLWGAIVMATFGLATIPALFFLGTMTKFLQKGSTREIMIKLAALLVVTYGFFTLYKGYKFIVRSEQTQQVIKETQTHSVENNFKNSEE